MRNFKPVTIVEINKVWGNANFGTYMNNRKVAIVKDALLKWASDYSTGYTAFRILVDLGLMTEKRRLTARGRRQLWVFFGDNCSGV